MDSPLTQQQQLGLLWLQLDQQEHQITMAVRQTDQLRNQLLIETQYRNDTEVINKCCIELSPLSRREQLLKYTVL